MKFICCSRASTFLHPISSHWHAKLLAFALFLCFVLCACRDASGRSTRQRTYLEHLTEFVHAHEHELLHHAEMVLSGRIEKVKPFIYYAPPSDPLIAQRVLGVTFDTNRNVYFILKDSFTPWNVGIILNHDNMPFLGDQCEPTIITNIHLFGKWFYYKAT